MFSKSQVNHKTIWHNSGMNDDQLNNKVVIQTCTQQHVKVFTRKNLLSKHMQKCISDLCHYLSFTTCRKKVILSVSSVCLC